MLGPAVQQQDGIVVAGAGLGNVVDDPIGADEAVADAFDVEQVGQNGQIQAPRASNSAPGIQATSQALPSGSAK